MVSDFFLYIYFLKKKKSWLRKWIRNIWLCKQCHSMVFTWNGHFRSFSAVLPGWVSSSQTYMCWVAVKLHANTNRVGRWENQKVPVKGTQENLFQGIGTHESLNDGWHVFRAPVNRVTSLLRSLIDDFQGCAVCPSSGSGCNLRRKNYLHIKLFRYELISLPDV